MTDTPSSQEYILLDYAERLDRHREGRRAVHFHLSALKNQNRREHHLRIAANTLEDFARPIEGQIFTLGNADIVFACKGVSLEQLDDIVMRMRYLFVDDPLTSAEAEDEGFATVYNIETQYPHFLALCKELHREYEARTRRLQALAQQSGETAAVVDTRRPLTPQQLGRLEETLERADLSTVLRRQAICAVSRDGELPKPVFNELYVSIADLAKTVLPDVDLASNRWLFQHLTETLDRRVLKLLSRAEDSSLHSAFSINLNVATVLSKEFLDFDGSLRMGSRGTLVIELQFIDVLADYAGFNFARDFAREKGYRLCLDGITPQTLPFVDRKRLGVDLIKLAASEVLDVPDGEESPKLQDLAQEVARVGKGRVILSRVDNDRMLHNGQAMGITMFQGRLLDQVLQRIARQRAPAPPPKVQRASR